MQTLRIELIGNNSLKALKELEYKNLIRIVNGSDLNSYALPGEPINESDFKNWVEYVEESSTISLTEGKKRWSAQKEKLQQLIR